MELLYQLSYNGANATYILLDLLYFAMSDNIKAFIVQETKTGLRLISRGGGVVPHEAHNLETPVQFRPPQQDLF